MKQRFLLVFMVSSSLLRADLAENALKLRHELQKQQELLQELCREKAATEKLLGEAYKLIFTVIVTNSVSSAIILFCILNYMPTRQKIKKE